MREPWWVWHWDTKEAKDVAVRYLRIMRWRRGSFLTVYRQETNGDVTWWIYLPFNLGFGFSYSVEVDEDEDENVEGGEGGAGGKGADGGGDGEAGDKGPRGKGGVGGKPAKKCSQCGGRGTCLLSGYELSPKTCPRCGGSGKEPC